MCVGRLPLSCRGILYGLEHHQDRGGHPAPLWSCPLASDGCGDGCGNILVCSPHARKMFCLVLPIEPRNVRSPQQPVSAARQQGDKEPAMCPRVLSPPSDTSVTAVLQDGICFPGGELRPIRAFGKTKHSLSRQPQKSRINEVEGRKYFSQNGEPLLEAVAYL